MRFVDIMLCFPSFFLILTVVALLPASIYNIMIVIGLTSWMGTTRFVRAEFLSLREQDFVTAAWALGVSDWRIIFRHMVPNAIGPVLVSATIGIATAILTEAGLSFLGFGVPPPHATWGNILSDGKRFIFDAPWLTFIPGIAILIVVLSFNLFGEGLRDILNPKLRQ
jgi:peptide/nickel transport system permease protein